MDEIALNEYNLPENKIQDSYVDDYSQNDVLAKRNDAIIQSKNSGLSTKELCVEFKLSRRQIRRICNGTK